MSVSTGAFVWWPRVCKRANLLPSRALERQRRHIRYGRCCKRLMSGEKGPKRYRPDARLGVEHSPYLLQHADNPVDWYPWGNEAFEAAKKYNKPIFLSIGYSTCHWCHVMAHESFEDDEIAAIMNEKFINVKVDREERPDVDRVYMSYIQATNGSGGWPMSVFLTPDLQPFFGGTYFPPNDRYGRHGFPTVLKRISEVWDTKEEEVRKSANDIVRQLTEIKGDSLQSRENSEDNEDLEGLGFNYRESLKLCYQQLKERFDDSYGGFGDAPKFPRPSEILFLFRYREFCEHDKTTEVDPAEISKMALHTLRMMGNGGINDHVGGGFHRYSVDELWHVPHFEKMLYDQGQLVTAYIEAYQLTNEEIFARHAKTILDYLLRSMFHCEGGFYSAEDADSYSTSEGKNREGEFYVWADSEVDDILSKASRRSDIFKHHYSFKTDGNCIFSSFSDPHGEFRGKNVLFAKSDVRETAHTFDISVDDCREELAKAASELYDVRKKRPKPHVDDKIITAWNGLAISGLAKASVTLYKVAENVCLFPANEKYGRESYLDAARKTASRILARRNKNGLLIRSFREENGPLAFADDYAYFIQGLLDLYEASGETRWLREALALQEVQDRLFLDNQHGGYFSSTEDDKSILIRIKDDYDGAEPSASSISALNLLRLSSIFQSSIEFTKKGTDCIRVFSERLKAAPLALPQMCIAIIHLVSSFKPQIVFSKDSITVEEALPLLEVAHRRLCKSLIIIDPSSADDSEFWAAKNDMAWNMVTGSSSRDSKAVVHVCKDMACQEPTSSPEKLSALLQESSQLG